MNIIDRVVALNDADLECARATLSGADPKPEANDAVRAILEKVQGDDSSEKARLLLGFVSDELHRRFLDKAIAAMTDDELAAAAAKLAKRAQMQSMLGMADLYVARFEPPSAAVDAVLDGNLVKASKIASTQRLVRAEIQRRATLTADAA